MKPDEREAMYDELATNLADPVAYAADAGVRFGIEPLNRFESHFINVAGDAVAFCKDVGLPNIKVHLRTSQLRLADCRGNPDHRAAQSKRVPRRCWRTPAQWA